MCKNAARSKHSELEGECGEVVCSKDVNGGIEVVGRAGAFKRSRCAKQTHTSETLSWGETQKLEEST